MLYQSLQAIHAVSTYMYFASQILEILVIAKPGEIDYRCSWKPIFHIHDIIHIDRTLCVWLHCNLSLRSFQLAQCTIIGWIYVPKCTRKPFVPDILLCGCWNRKPRKSKTLVRNDLPPLYTHIGPDGSSDGSLLHIVGSIHAHRSWERAAMSVC